MKKTLIIFNLLLFYVNSYGQIIETTILSEGAKLNAYYYKAPGDNLKPTVIWMHGIPGQKETGKLEIAMELNKRGFNSVAFNYRGLWNDQGLFSTGNAVNDLASVISFLYDSDNITKFSIDTNRIIVAGHSYGSNIAILSGILDVRVNEIMCLALADFSYVYRGILNPDNDNLEMRAWAQRVSDRLWGDDKLIKDYESFNSDLLINNFKYDFVAQSDKLMDNRILIVVGSNDLTTPIENHFFPLYRKLQKAGHPDLNVIITESDHKFTDTPKSEIADMITDWVKSKN
jgi:pimeloyl-ACP methyl ester carboxylesterase